jgi:hypothetical protein
MKVSIGIIALCAMIFGRGDAQQKDNTYYKCPILQCESPISPKSVVQETSRLII